MYLKLIFKNTCNLLSNGILKTNNELIIGDTVIELCKVHDDLDICKTINKVMMFVL